MEIIWSAAASDATKKKQSKQQIQFLKQKQNQKQTSKQTNKQTNKNKATQHIDTGHVLYNTQHLTINYQILLILK